MIVDLRFKKMAFTCKYACFLPLLVESIALSYRTDFAAEMPKLNMISFISSIDTYLNIKCHIFFLV